MSPIEKPLDTLTHIQARIEWVRKYYDLLTDDDSPVAFLDEKWFYTTNRRNKLKHLPLQPGEAPGSDKLYRSKMRCRCHPVKSMFLGVVARPRPHLHFDGKIHIERFSKTRPSTRMCTHTSFSHDICINLMLKKGQWMDLADFKNDDWTTAEVLSLIAEHYNLTEDVEKRLELQYNSHTKGELHGKKL